MTPESLPACERVTVLDWRQSAHSQCDVCDRPGSEHPASGRRTLSGEEVEALRRTMIIERSDQLERRQKSADGDGQG